MAILLLPGKLDCWGVLLISILYWQLLQLTKTNTQGTAILASAKASSHGNPLRAPTSAALSRGSSNSHKLGK